MSGIEPICPVIQNSVAEQSFLQARQSSAAGKITMHAQPEGESIRHFNMMGNPTISTELAPGAQVADCPPTSLSRQVSDGSEASHPVG